MGLLDILNISFLFTFRFAWGLHRLLTDRFTMPREIAPFVVYLVSNLRRNDIKDIRETLYL